MHTICVPIYFSFLSRIWHLSNSLLLSYPSSPPYIILFRKLSSKISPYTMPCNTITISSHSQRFIITITMMMTIINIIILLNNNENVLKMNENMDKNALQPQILKIHSFIYFCSRHLPSVSASASFIALLLHCTHCKFICIIFFQPSLLFDKITYSQFILKYSLPQMHA